MKDHHRTMYVYLYRLHGEPMYVGQACNVARRDVAHRRGRTTTRCSYCPFDGHLQTVGRDKFTLEVVDQCRDVPAGKEINRLENAAMDRFGTYYLESGKGWNFGRAEKFGNNTVATWKAHRAANEAAKERIYSDPEIQDTNRANLKKLRADPEIQAKRLVNLKAALQRPEVTAKRKVSRKRLFASPEYKALMESQEVKAAFKAGIEKREADPKYRAARKAAAKKRSLNPEWRAAQRSGSERKQADPKYKAARLERAFKNPRTRRRYRQGLCSAIYWDGWHRKRRFCKRKHAPGFVRCDPCRNADTKMCRKRRARKAAAAGSFNFL